MDHRAKRNTAAAQTSRGIETQEDVSSIAGGVLENSGKRPVLLLAETGFVIRNLLLGTFAEAMMKRRPLAVAVPEPGHPELLAMRNGLPLELVRFHREPDPPPLTRLQKLGNWQIYMYWFRQAQKEKGATKIQNRLYASKHSAVGTAVIQALTWTGRLLKRTRAMGLVEAQYLEAMQESPIVREWVRALERLRPAAILSTTLTLATINRPSRDLAPVLAARRLGIPCGTLVLSWDNLASKASVIPLWLDRYWTWSRAMSRELLALYPDIPAERVKVVGSPQFDFHRRPELVEPREQYCARRGLDPERPIVLIGTGTAVRLPGEPATVLDLTRSLHRSLGRVQVMVRLHPKDDGTRWNGVRGELEALGTLVQRTAPPTPMDTGGFVPPGDFYQEQINALSHAAAVINISSTLTVDAAILDRPVICLAYDVEPDPKFPEGRAKLYAYSSHYARLVATGGVAVVGSAAECVRAVEAYVADPGLHREGRREIVEIVAGPADGRVGERLAAEVAMLAEA